MAQERGEVSSGRNGPGAGVLNGNAKATAKEIGLTRKEIHEARAIRDAEKRGVWVPDLTCTDGIKLNVRVSLRRAREILP
jgi:hypothetical protein